MKSKLKKSDYTQLNVRAFSFQKIALQKTDTAMQNLTYLISVSRTKEVNVKKLFLCNWRQLQTKEIRSNICEQRFADQEMCMSISA